MRRVLLLAAAVALSGCRSAAPAPEPPPAAEAERIGLLLVELQLADGERVGKARVELVRAGPAATPRLVGLAYTGTPRAAANAVEVLGARQAKEAIAPLCAILTSQRPLEVRLAAARALGAIASPIAVGGLSQVLARGECAEVRAACLEALGRIDDPRAGTAALAALRDPAEMVRAAALEAVAARRPEGAADALAATYAGLPSSGAWKKKERILAVLVSCKDPRAQGLLLDALCNPFSSPTRREAARLLGELGDPRAVHALIEALFDRRPEVALAAHQSLVRLTGRSAPDAPPVDDEPARARLQADWKRWIEEHR